MGGTLDSFNTRNARLKCGRGSRCAFLFSDDGVKWRPVAEASGEDTRIRASLDPYLSEKGAARYSYLLRLEMVSESSIEEVGIESLAIENDLQMAPLSMPALQLGDNRNYQFQLSDRQDMRWALASNFDLLISETDNRGTTSFELKQPGLLNPGQPYYWRVRAKTEKGVWGPWSPAWSFVSRAPGVPRQLRLYQAGNDNYELAWDINPNGRKPVRFEIYASDEKGFSVSDTPYQVPTGNQPSRGLFPATRST